MHEEIKEYALEEVEVNVLKIERTFLDKVMAVKRHAMCGTLIEKVRHIYDVTMLYQREEIQLFLKTEELKQLIRTIKESDGKYLENKKIEVSDSYNLLDKYNFKEWKDYFNDAIKNRYECLHEDLLYTNQKQEFSEAIHIFEKIDSIFEKIGE